MCSEMSRLCLSHCQNRPGDLGTDMGQLRWEMKLQNLPTKQTKHLARTVPSSCL